MKKISVLWILLDLIFLVIFNSVFFIIGGKEHNYSVWISYGFIHFAYLMLLLTPIVIRKGKSSSVFGFSLYSISAVYFFLEFVIGIVLIVISQESINTTLLVQLIIAGLYGIILISNMIANEHSAEAEEKRQYENEYIKNASAKLKGLMRNISDKEEKKKIERVYNAIYSSPAKSHPNLAQVEDSILLSINELEDAVSARNKDKIILLADTLLSAVNDRNMRLKTLG